MTILFPIRVHRRPLSCFLSGFRTQVSSLSSSHLLPIRVHLCSSAATLCLLFLVLTSLTATAASIQLQNDLIIRRRTPAAPSDPAPTAAAQLICWLRGGPSDTGALIADASGNGNYFTNSVESERITVVDGYMLLNGSTHASNTTATLANGLLGITVTAWCYVTNWTDYDGVFVKFDGAAGGLVQRTAADKFFRGWGTSAGYADTPAGLSTGVWYNLALTWTNNASSDVATMYLNGVQVGQAIGAHGTATAVSDAWRVGWYDNNAAYKFQGRIDDCRIYNTSLASNLIWSIYQEGRR